jgi:hypothetical protein
MNTKRCKHNAGWYIQDAQLMADHDGSLTILPMPRGRHQRDKAVAVCNSGCGATRNVYLKSVEIAFGKVRKPQPESPS